MQRPNNTIKQQQTNNRLVGRIFPLASGCRFRGGAGPRQSLGRGLRCCWAWERQTPQTRQRNGAGVVGA
eukprot:4600983-Lingulodinium_polyedra.AAC.1